jgi:hypothetical protein
MRSVASRQTSWDRRPETRTLRRRAERERTVARLLDMRAWTHGPGMSGGLLAEPALVYIKGESTEFEVYDHRGALAGSSDGTHLWDGGRNRLRGRDRVLSLRSGLGHLVPGDTFAVVDAGGEVARVGRARLRGLNTLRRVDATDGSRATLRLPFFLGYRDPAVLDETGAPVARIRGHRGSYYIVEIASHTAPGIRPVTILAPMIWHNRIEVFRRQMGG